MPYAQQAPKPGRNGGHRGPGSWVYRRAVEQVRVRAVRGEPCWFCGGPFDWTLPHQHRLAFTAHHVDRLMDGGQLVPDPKLMVPAHRSCNSADGLRAQNQRRRDHPIKTRGLIAVPERRSRDW